MNVIVAKTAGFCFGVKRAVDKVYEQVLNSKEKIFTYGPIIHNEEVVNDLAKRGVQVINDENELTKLNQGTVIIRSHGVSEHIYNVIKEKGLKCVDATCPFVKKIHKIVRDESQKGNYIIIIGDKNHPEVQGIKGWCVNNDISIIKSEDEARDFTLKEAKKVCIVSQTTFNYNKFKDLVEIIEKKGYDIITINTICSATEERQKEAAKIASGVDAMIVIGGKSSYNTQKLFEICKKECENTYYIQTLVDMDLRNFESTNNVGITAGASTPNKIIEEVQRNVRIKF